MRLLPLSQSYGCPTTRRHPRSMAEAFPADFANPIEHHVREPRWHRAAGALLAVAIAAALVNWWRT